MIHERQNDGKTKMKSTTQRRERERDARRQAILAQAKSVFAERGFLNATVEEIAERAELAVGTLYRYFQSKEEIYVSLLFEAMNIFYDRIETIRASARRRTRNCARCGISFTNFIRANPNTIAALSFCTTRACAM